MCCDCEFGAIEEMFKGTLGVNGMCGEANNEICSS
jgi:hypothetical protein